MEKYIYRLLLTVFAIGNVAVVCADDIDFNNYEPLQSKGNIPARFLVSASDDYVHRKQEIDGTQEKKTQKAEEEFHLKSSYAMHDVLYSGSVMYGDPITEYVNKVADEVLKGNPSLRKEISIFVNRSSIVNAYCFPNGVILINIGVLAQLEDESQLALIIAHEIAHYLEKHGLDLSLKKSEMSRGGGKYKDFSIDEMQLEYSVHSQEHELEADLKGLKTIKKTNYDLSGAEDVFNVLKYSYLPYDDISIDLSMFEPRKLPFPEDFYIPEDKVKKIDYGNEEENELSTHPTAEARKEAVLVELIDLDLSGREKYIVGEDQFKMVQKIARYELSDIYLNSGQYDQAIYNSFLNNFKYDEKKFNDLVIAKSLYSLSKYKKEGKSSLVKSNYRNIEGASQPLYYLTDQLDDEGMCAVAISNILELSLKYTDEPILNKMLEDLIKDMVISYEHNSDWFKLYTPVEEQVVKEEFIELSEDEINDLTKLEKIKYRKELESFTEKDGATDNFAQYAFGNKLENRFIKESFSNANKAKLAKESELDKDKKDYFSEKDLEVIKSKGLGIKNMIVLDPFYRNNFYTNKENYFAKNESLSLEYNEKIKSIGGKLNMNLRLLDDKTINSNSLDYNTFCRLKTILKQQIFHFVNEIEILNTNEKQCLEISKHYDANHLALLGTLGARSRYNFIGGWTAISGIVNPLILAYGLGKVIAPDYITSHYYVLLNFETGKIEGVQLHAIDLKPSSSIVNSMLYDVLYTTSKTPKK